MSIPITGLTYIQNYEFFSITQAAPRGGKFYATLETAEVESASKMFTSGLPSCRNRSRPLMEASYKSPHALYHLYSFFANSSASKKLDYLSHKKRN